MHRAVADPALRAGLPPHPFIRDYWRYLDIDVRRQRAPARRLARSGWRRRDALALGAGTLALGPARGDAAARAARCCAWPCPRPRPASTRCASATSIRPPSTPTSSSRCTPSTTWPGRQAEAPRGRRHARAFATTSACGPCASDRASSSPTTRPSRAAARAHRAGLRLHAQALCRPGQYLAQLALGGRAAHPGLAALRERALKDKKPFDYDAPVEGLRTLDRHTLQITLERPQPRFAENFTWRRPSRAGGARGRRVLRRQAIMEHPVGTGPFRLASWRRSRASCSSATRLPRRALGRRTRAG
jgi:hypothetical protein